MNTAKVLLSLLKMAYVKMFHFILKLVLKKGTTYSNTISLDYNHRTKVKKGQMGFQSQGEKILALWWQA